MTTSSPDTGSSATRSVVFDPEDLTGYVGRLFDYVVKHPEVLRLVTWAGLERPTAASRFEVDAYRAKLETSGSARPGSMVTILPAVKASGDVGGMALL